MSVRVHLTGAPDVVELVQRQIYDLMTILISAETTFWTLTPEQGGSRDVCEVILCKDDVRPADRALLRVCAAIYPGLCWEITDADNERLPEELPCEHGNYRRDSDPWNIFRERSSTLYSFKAVKGRYEHAWVDSGIIMRHFKEFAQAVYHAFLVVYDSENAHEAAESLFNMIRDIDAATPQEYEITKRVYEDIRASVTASLPD